MRVYRLVNSIYSTDLTGEGARLHGGRWNHIGVPCVYASENRSLAVLEFSVNVQIQSILRNLSMVELDIPEDFHEVHIADLPGNWRDAPAPASTKDFGSALLKDPSFGIIKIPSTVIPEEYNYILNPQHASIAKCKVIQVTDFVFDIRIKDGK
jgi:RES domain-containing protein